MWNIGFKYVLFEYKKEKKHSKFRFYNSDNPQDTIKNKRLQYWSYNKIKAIEFINFEKEYCVPSYSVLTNPLSYIYI